MERIVAYVARVIRAGMRAYKRKWAFLGLFVLVFFGSVATLAQLDLLPAVPASAKEGAHTPAVPAPTIPELPTLITIPVLGLSVPVANPTTTDSALLDQALLKGAVRYPTSARLNEGGNVVLFGHSSYLPIVGNQAYKTFNGIQKLKEGDVITVSSSDATYTYRVRSVSKESANDATIPLVVSGKVLTLATCNSFATKADRFVVVADFVESHSVSL